MTIRIKLKFQFLSWVIRLATYKIKMQNINSYIFNQACINGLIETNNLKVKFVLKLSLKC